MSKPILQILNAGFGETPECPDAKFSVGDVVRVRRLKHLRELPKIAVIAVIVPPGIPAEYAKADALGEPRPLMITKPRRCISYVIGFEDDPLPMLINESALLPTDEPRAEVIWKAPSDD